MSSLETGMINPDIQKERDSASFQVEKLTHFLDGGQHKTEQRKSVGKFLTQNAKLTSVKSSLDSWIRNVSILL